MSHGTFATAINCMDGRTQLSVNEWMKNKYAVEFVDTITEPGPVKILAENTDKTYLDSIKRRLDISINKHHSSAICIIAHHDCAGNPVEKDIQIEQLKKASEVVKGWFGNIEVVTLWVDENWLVNQI
jgi:carbonic anhydrase